VLESLFQDASESDGLTTAVVTEAAPAVVKAVLVDGEAVEVSGDGLKFVAGRSATRRPRRRGSARAQ
jgi:hypothetical protein